MDSSITFLLVVNFEFLTAVDMQLRYAAVDLQCKARNLHISAYLCNNVVIFWCSSPIGLSFSDYRVAVSVCPQTLPALQFTILKSQANYFHY